MRRIIYALALLAPLAAMAQTADQTPPLTSGQQKFIARFDAANTTHDGHLTLAQAQAAGMHGIVKHFAAIDTTNKGYVTLQDIQAWHLAHPRPAPPAQPPMQPQQQQPAPPPAG
jgi:hypothetical protein